MDGHAGCSCHEEAFLVLLLEKHELHLVILQLVIASSSSSITEPCIEGGMSNEAVRSHNRRVVEVCTVSTRVRFAAHAQPICGNLDVEGASAV